MNFIVTQFSEFSECIFVKSEEGLYSYSSPGGYKEVCGLYIIADPSEVAVFEFEEFDISCENDGLASMVIIVFIPMNSKKNLKITQTYRPVLANIIQTLYDINFL